MQGSTTVFRSAGKVNKDTYPHTMLHECCNIVAAVVGGCVREYLMIEPSKLHFVEAWCAQPASVYSTCGLLIDVQQSVE